MGGPEFLGRPAADRGRDRVIAAIVGLALVAFVATSLVKPWDWLPEPTVPESSILGAAPSTIATPAPEGTPAPERTTPPGGTTPATPAPIRLPVAFSMAAPPPTAARWTGLRWRRLAADDPLALVTDVVRWSGGFIALGFDPRLPATPVWTSVDGRRWEPLVFGTGTSFWPGQGILAIAGMPGGLVALTETLAYCGTPCPVRYVAPVFAWSSRDGRTWRIERALPPDWVAHPLGSAPLAAPGPGGIVLASRGPDARVATSADGARWSLLAAGAFPARFALSDLRATPDGYVAIGRWLTVGTEGAAASLWSADGRHWTPVPTVLPARLDPRSAWTAADRLAQAPRGMIAIGRDIGLPGTLWWESPDGRTWRPVQGFVPVGATRCPVGFCAFQPEGALAGDGARLVAVRGGPSAAAWTSADGRSWHALAMTGDLPTVDVRSATLLPGGVLVSDGSTTWFGEALTDRTDVPDGASKGATPWRAPADR